jgi:uncharacterized repeat protein (TIGR01451 family)
MKKVWVISFLVLMALFSGCQSTDSEATVDEAKPAATRSPRTYFWDKDLRPTIAIPSRPRAQAQPEAVPAEPQPQPVIRDRTETTRKVPVIPPDLLTASVQEIEPVKSTFVTPARERTTSFGPGLVSVAEAEGHTLSITYPGPDYGIIQIDKVLPEEVRANSPFAYAIKVTNLTQAMLTEIAITETISEGFEFKASEPAALTEDNKLVWKIDSLGPEASKSIRISGVAGDTRQLEYVTGITHTIRDRTIVKVVEPTLELAKMAPSEALLCEPIQVDFLVTNTGTGAAHNVQIVDNLPAGLQTTDGKTRIVLDAGTLAAGESRRFSVKLRATKTGAYVNKAMASSASGLTAESEPTLTNIRQPLLIITKSGPKRQYLGRSITCKITVANQGDGPARDTMLEDTIPSAVTSIEATAGAQFSASKLTWELGTLEPNTSKEVEVSYTPTREGEFMATATATAYCAEPVTDSTKTVVAGIAAPHLEVIDLEDPVEIGNTTTYVISVSNEGSAADGNVRIMCLLDEKLQYVSSAGATAGSIMGQTVNFTPLRNLEPKTKATWRVVVRGTRAGDARFKVTMHTDQLALPVEETEATHIYQQYNGD